MTAALEGDTTPHDESRYYPERISIRLNDASKNLYAELEDAYFDDGVSLSHRVLALVDLFWAEGTPEQRQLITERAEEIKNARFDRANQARSRRIHEYLASDELQAKRNARRERQAERRRNDPM